MKRPTMEEVLELVDFGRDDEGCLIVRSVKGSIRGSVRGNVGIVCGDVELDVCGTVKGTIGGRFWEFYETPIVKDVLLLIREGNLEEAIKLLEESE